MVMASSIGVEVIVDVVLTAWKELKNTRKFSYHSPSQSPFRVQLAFSRLYSNNNSTMGPLFFGRPVLAGNIVQPYQVVAQGEPSFGYAENGKRDNGYPPQPLPLGACYGARVMNGGGGYGASLSPISPDGLGTNENCGGQFGLEMGMLRGRKRIIDGQFGLKMGMLRGRKRIINDLVEKVVEGRQMRMIKNRELAARSRARKQACAFFALL